MDQPDYPGHRTRIHVRGRRGRDRGRHRRALAPRWGSLIVAAWLAGIIVNLLTAEPLEYYDIALRDFGLFLAALTLNRLAMAFGATSVRSEVRELRRAA
jgi:hypothetical protein